jgi:hypothetical protein
VLVVDGSGLGLAIVREIVEKHDATLTVEDARPPVGEHADRPGTLFTVRFIPVDIVSVVRRNKSLLKGNFHQAAERDNFFLRGFNSLFIARKPDEAPRRPQQRPRSPR